MDKGCLCKHGVACINNKVGVDGEVLGWSNNGWGVWVPWKHGVACINNKVGADGGVLGWSNQG